MTFQPADDIVRVETQSGPMWVFKSDVYVSRSLQVYGEYGAAESALFSQIVRSGMTVIEVGANIGSHSVQLAKSCFPGPFIAFEPQQRVFQLLTANLVINGLANALVFPVGIGSKDGLAEFSVPNYAATGNFGSVSLLQPSVGENNRQRVRISTLDTWGFSACHFLKVDVEGWECDVIDGAQKTIKRYRPVIYLENDRTKSQGELIAKMAQLDYDLYWHVAPLFRDDNFKKISDNIFGNTASLNMLCTPRERNIPVAGLPKIDPANWKSPFPGL